ncbi:MAG: D-alanine--D-alanine ligase [Flexistipes sinusarabici]|uniref:D-alanine--D-alanine ligase n=1 Tax=Flexistipes sinusarabici TaxID=2352 RepID=A0A5D0MLV4_FLESI|nr:D-alanine--D-alanine ligase [Flexistipes sinusarabici]TYB33976.1 MAG: D-alanine--D-alanine ligase [Flexistipes sinusarabici]
MIDKNKKIVVLYGGFSSEREVSLSTGSAMGNALKKSGYENVIFMDIGDNFFKELLEIKPDICVNGLHGKFGEDGKIQAVLESLRIPYTGSGVAASCIAFDKAYSKYILKGAGLPTAEFIITSEDNREPPFLPCVVKPAREGSTIGISIVKQEGEYKRALETAAGYDDKIVVEKFLDGKEITVGILGDKALPPIWIKPKSGFYDYGSKYTKGKTEYLFDTGCTEKEISEIKDTALRAFKVSGCTGYGRADFIYKDNIPYILEINTLPGMTETSLLPQAAAEAGIDFEKLVEEILYTSGESHD